MPEPTIDELLVAESGMDTSFSACAIALLAKLGWVVVMVAIGGVA